MKSKQNELDITVKGFNNMGTVQKARQFVDLLINNGLNPLRFGESEYTRWLFNVDEFVRLWVEMEVRNGMGGVFIKGKGFVIDVGWGGAVPYTTWMSISTKLISDWDAALALLKDLYIWYGACYGYAALEEATGRLYSPGKDITICLGGITWANLFGKPYVDMWGEEKLINAPTWKTERLADGSFLLVTTESPMSDRAVADEAEAKLRAYLGEEHFYKKPIKQEILSFEGLLRKMADPPRDIGYVAPDFEKYYNLGA